MSLMDIVYLYSRRMTSLLSQLLGAVAERGHEADTEHETRAAPPKLCACSLSDRQGLVA